jgi:hypothetical protein
MNKLREELRAEATIAINNATGNTELDHEDKAIFHKFIEVLIRVSDEGLEMFESGKIPLINTRLFRYSDRAEEIRACLAYAESNFESIGFNNYDKDCIKTAISIMKTMSDKGLVIIDDIL